ncbi:GNAT family N-acetyltransferase [uncultured Psychroserpens sp.]|uniref:GNAT family N-acetyltransferase n=1 Tax=uncultured Psychroserpens sp. TaxID=255436 RepID=UPI002602319E|nr:GNAT family N-acetyltransferase [uncultured Psychroserpens sp.]
MNSVDSKVDLSIRLFEDSDVNALDEGMRHARLVQENIPDCYVAVTKDNTTIFRQWLFKHQQNNQVANYFGNIFPSLKEDEALIEGVFTHPDYRGLRVMPNAVYKTLIQDQYKGINRVIVFVDENNIPSLKGFHRNGFRPYITRQEKWFLFYRRVSFIPMTTKLEYSYLNLASATNLKTS